MVHEITSNHGITMGGKITMWREITTATEIMMGGEIIMMRRSQRMDALRVGRFKVEIAHPTKVPLAVGGAPGTAARTVTQSKAASVSRILDHVSQKAE